MLIMTTAAKNLAAMEARIKTALVSGAIRAKAVAR
jgi:hypothetical protein